MSVPKPAPDGTEDIEIIDLMGHLAHALNNLLGSIQGNAELVSEMPDDPELVSDCADDILLACRSMGDLSWRLRAAARRTAIERKAVGLVGWLEALKSAIPDTAGGRVDLTTIHQGPDEQVLIDGDHLARGFRMLLADAANAGAHAALIATRVVDDELVMAFTDDRKAVNARARPTFDLTLVAFERLIEGMGGQCDIVWTDGLQIEARLPARPQPYAEPMAVAAAPCPGRVIVVDDEEALGRMVRRVLEHRGYDVEVFSDPQAALGALLNDPSAYDVALFDVMMPGLTGPQLLATLRRFGVDLPTVLMTGAAPEEVHALDAAGTLSKPFTREQLEAAIAKVHGEGAEAK